MFDLYHKIRPRSPLLRAYILGVATGMGAAIAYLIGLLHRRKRERKQEHYSFHFGIPLGTDAKTPWEAIEKLPDGYFDFEKASEEKQK